MTKASPNVRSSPSMAAGSGDNVSTASTSSSTNAYLQALTSELSGICLQYTTASGNLSEGGMGVWVYLQYQRALKCGGDVKERLRLLTSARDAAIEALRNATPDPDTSGDSLFGSNETSNSTSSSMSLYTNPLLGCHVMLAAIYYQLMLLQQGNHNPKKNEDYKAEMKSHIQDVLEILDKTLREAAAATPNNTVDASLWTGRAGAMQTIFFLRQHTSQPYLGQALLVKIAKQLILDGRKTAREYQRMIGMATSHHDVKAPALLWHTNVGENNRSTSWNYDLGTPYGLTGILTTLLALSEEEWQVIEQVSEFDVDGDIFRNARALIKETIDGLPQYGCHVSSGNLRTQLDNVLQDVDRRVDWSHGAPCHILLLLSAHEVFGSSQEKGKESCLEQAQRLADEVVWARRILLTKNGLGLMTGMTGNAYVLMQLSQALSSAAASTKSSKNRDQFLKLSEAWKQRGEELARHCVHHWRELLAVSSVGQQMQAPYSLMGGLGGLVSLLMDLNHPHALSQARFPLTYRSKMETTPATAPATIAYPVQAAARTTEQKGYVQVQKEIAKREATQGPPHSRSPGRRPARKVSPARSPKQSPSRGNAKAPKTVKSQNVKKDNVPEFVSPAITDRPDKKFLRMQVSSDTLEGHSPQFYSQDGAAMNPPLLDEEAHKACLNKIPSEDDADEFEDPNSDDAPDERFLRLQDTDDEDNADLFYAQDGGALNPSVLDDEGHTISAIKQKNGIVEGHDAVGVPDFATPSRNEKPDKRFLQLQDPDNEGDMYYKQSSNRAVNPPLLDEEGHAVATKHSTSAELEDLPEFQTPSNDDLPNQEFLRMQDSSDDMYYEYPEANQGKGLLDEEALMQNNRLAMANKSQEESDVEEFVEASSYDEPIQDYLRMQDSTDEMFYHYDSKENPTTLDEEDHMAEARAERQSMTSEYTMSDEEFSQQDFEMEAYRPPVPNTPRAQEHGITNNDEDDDEFELAAESDQPNVDYLRGNMSMDHLSVEDNNENCNAVPLDEEGHRAIDMDQLAVSKLEEEDADEFGETADDESPDSRYLLKQDSSTDIYYDHHGDQERLLETKKHVKRVAKQAAGAAETKKHVKLVAKHAAGAAETKKHVKLVAKQAASAASKVIPHQTPTKKKGRKNDFKRDTPVRGTPASTGTATTSAMSLPSPIPQDKVSSKTYLDVAKSCFQDAAGEGSLLNGGLGVAVYLRIKLSEIETNPNKAREYLHSALNYARAAVEDSQFDSGRKKHLSMIASDAIGSQCLLASVLFRLGQRNEAKKVADGVVVNIADLFESCDKTDCSVLFGLAGALQAIWFLRKEFNDATFGSEIALTISSTILLEGLEHSEKYDTSALLMWEWHDRPFLGAGTGATGILYTLLGHTKDEWQSLNACLPRVLDVIRQCIDSLSEQKLESGNLMAAADGYEEDRSTDWCHGAPGYLLLLLKAYDVFDDTKYLDQAKHLAEHVIWPRRMQRKGLGLSRGVTGVAYTLLALARVDEENWKLWRSRATKMAQLALSDLDELQDLSKNPNSLFEGTGGLVSLLLDLERPTTEIWFPCFEYSVTSRHGQSKGNQGHRIAKMNIVSTGSKSTPQAKRSASSPHRSPATNMKTPTSYAKSPSAGAKGRANAKSVTGTATTATAASTTEARDYETPPRGGVMLAVSPLTEPSPGPSPKVDSYPLTDAKKQMRRHKQQREARQQKPASHADYPSKICPPQVKRHIYTRPDEVPLANRPTSSWLAKQGAGSRDSTIVENYDVFTRDSLERKLRAEESWFKHEVHSVYVTKKHDHPSEQETSFRRMVGAFSKPPPKSVSLAPQYPKQVVNTGTLAPREESLHEKMSHVVEELSGRLEDIGMIE